MTPFEKQVYYDMQSTDRVLLWMIKCQELMEFVDIMTEEDIRVVRQVCNLMEKEGERDEVQDLEKHSGGSCLTEEAVPNGHKKTAPQKGGRKKGIR